jgi:hypothetical protein
MSTITRQPIIGPSPANRDEWLSARQRLITSTDIAKIMRGEWWALYHTKLGDLPEFACNRATRRGNRFQRPTLEEYAEEANAVVYDNLPLLIDSDCPQLAASPDAFAFAAPEGTLPSVADVVHMDGVLLASEGAYGVEAKTSLSISVATALAEGDDESDIMPQDWVWQAQVQMACTEWEYVDFAILLFGKLKRRRVVRNAYLIDAARSTAVEYTDRIARHLEPPFDGAAAANQDAVKALYKPAVGVTIDLSQAAAETWAKRAAAAKIESDSKREKDAFDAALRAQFGNAEIGTLPDGSTLRLGTVHCDERVQKAYDFTRFWYKAAAKAKKGT